MPAEPILDIDGGTYQLIVATIISVLQKAQNLPIVIISINGLFRDGKSYLLNYFLRYLQNQDNPNWTEVELQEPNCFCHRSGPDRETVGLNIWPDPLIIKHNNRDFAVILLDSQGFFDPETNFIQNPAIYSFSCLLSSMVIYNKKNKITEDLFQEILMFSNYASTLSSKTSADTSKPSLLLLIRDFEYGKQFEFGFHDQNKKPPGDKANLFQKTFHDEKIIEGNRAVRQEMLQIYSSVGIFTTPHPGLDFVEENSPPKPDFMEKIKELVLHMMSNLVTKKIGEEEMTGGKLISHVEIWADICKNPGFPTPETFQSTSTRLQNEKALAVALLFFKTRYKNIFLSAEAGVSDADFRKQYDGIQRETMEIYENYKKLGSPAVIQEYSERLKKECEEYFKFQCEWNTVRRREKLLDDRLSEAQRRNNELAAENRTRLFTLALETTGTVASKYFEYKALSDQASQLAKVVTKVTKYSTGRGSK